MGRIEELEIDIRRTKSDVWNTSYYEKEIDLHLLIF